MTPPPDGAVSLLPPAPTRTLRSDVMLERARRWFERAMLVEWALCLVVGVASGAWSAEELLGLAAVAGALVGVPYALARSARTRRFARHAMAISLASFPVLVHEASSGAVPLVRHLLVVLFLTSLSGDAGLVLTVAATAAALDLGCRSFAPGTHLLDAQALVWLGVAAAALALVVWRVRRALDAVVAERALLERERTSIDARSAATYEQQLRSRVREAERAQRDAEIAERSAVLAALSHELRTPLNAVVGYLELLDSSSLTATQRGQVEGARSSAKHVLALVADVLDVAKIESGALELERAPFDVGACVRDAARLVEATVREKAIALTVEVAEELSTPFIGDALRVRQIVINLLGNAAKFTRTSVTVRARWVGETDSLVIEVLDDGPGIHPDRVARIFEPYRQADRSVARRHGGTGLGLSISRRLARLMRGDLVVTSELGKGSTFAFVAPLRRAEPAELAVPQTDEGAAPTPPLSVLLADDIASNRLVGGQLLELLGHRVELACDGEDALARALATPHDLLILDVEMPGLDGTEVARRLRTAGLSVPILGFTGHASVQQRTACLRAGMDGVICKPADLPKLTRAIAQVIASTHLRPDEGRAIAKSLASHVGVPTPPVGVPRPVVVEALAKRASVTTPGQPAPVARELGSGLDLEELDRRVGGDPQLFHDVLAAVRDESRRLLADLEKASSAGDLEQMRRLAHTLKGCVANVGARPVRDAVVAVEIAAKAGERERAIELCASAVVLGQSLSAALDHAHRSRAA